MEKIVETLMKPKTLWALLLAVILLSIGFGVVMKIWDFGLIDEIHDPEEILSHIAAMTSEQRRVHVWATATLDVAYPFAYGGLFIGMALKFFGRLGKWFALPSLLVIVVDLLEGGVQILLLNGQEQYVSAKAVLTPLKLGLFFIGFLIAIFASGLAFKAYIERRRQKRLSLD